MTFQLSRQDRAASHLEYEIKSLVCMWVRQGKTQDPHTEHALLEASLMHARLLIEFLIGRPKKGQNPNGAWGKRNPCDIQPGNFLDEWSVPSTEAVQRLKNVLPTLDQQLVHLSWERATPPGEWDSTVVRDLIEVLGVFVKALDEAKSPYAGKVQDALLAGQAPGGFDSGLIFTTNG